MPSIPLDAGQMLPLTREAMNLWGRQRDKQVCPTLLISVMVDRARRVASPQRREQVTLSANVRDSVLETR